MWLGSKKAGYNRSGLHFRVYEQQNVDLLDFPPRIFVRGMADNIEREMKRRRIVQEDKAREVENNGSIEKGIEEHGKAAV